MGTPINSNYFFTGYGPLDEKLLVDTFEDLPSSPYNGMIVAVDTENCSYIYTEQGWKKIVNESDLESYATIDYVDTQISQIAIPEIPSKLSDFENDKDYITASDVDKKIEDAQLNNEDIDLTEYYTKDEIDNKGYQTETQIVDLIDSYFANIKQAEDEEF